MALFLVIAAIGFPLVALFLLIATYSPKINPVAYGAIIGVCMGCIGFNLYNISEYSDLTRFMAQAMLTEGRTLQDSFVLFESSHLNDTPLGVIWFWIIGQTGNPQWYPATIAFVEYSIMGYIFTDYCTLKHYGRRRYLCLIVVMMFTLPLFDSVTSVRSTPALSIMLLAIYLEYCKGIHKPAVLTLYLIPPFLHSIGFIALPIRLLLWLSEQSRKLAVIVTFCMLPFAFLLSYAIEPIFTSFGISVVAKVQSYVIGDDSSGYITHILESDYAMTKKWIVLVLAAAGIALLYKTGRSSVRFATDEILGVRLNAIALILLSFIVSFNLLIAAPAYARFLYIALPITALCLVDSYMNQIQHRDAIRRMMTMPSGFAFYLACQATVVALSVWDLQHRIDIGYLVSHGWLGILSTLVA